jgi:replicative DNA helicase
MSTAKNLLPPVGDIAQGIMDTLRTGRPHPGLPVPVGELDTHLMGFRPGDLIYLSGDRSSGKTALALSIVRTLALQAHVGVLLFSPTQSADYLVSRLLAAECTAGTLSDVRLLRTDTQGFEGLIEAQQRLAKAPLIVCDQPNLSWEEFRHFSLGLQQEIGLIVIDALNGLRPPLSPKRETPTTDRLKQLAEQLHLPILALGPLAISPQSHADRRPTLGHLDPTHLASPDTILLTYCPSRYDLTSPDGSTLDDVMEVIVAKNRYNAEGSVFLHMDPMTLDCRDLAPEWKPTP